MVSCVILCLNSGSSSLKFVHYRMCNREELLLAQGEVSLNDGQITRIWIRSGREKLGRI